MNNELDSGYRESKTETVLLVFAILWFVLGLGTMVPAIPFQFVNAIGWWCAAGVAVILTILWLGVPLLAYKKAEGIRFSRQWRSPQ